ncbi:MULTISPECIES: M23 family metallopeptidase [unclassified Bartonella]|uniref:M23 family metallopeptidase n=1 Tax=unclassified Bartonella TaxID=2645622 RepID=UPI00099A44F8|nr:MULTISPECIES: M23 family metallopeptidase [unclassified Bartonella]AQX28392.1 Peptidase family M23 [Bartonella sp. JB15]AQX29659.1 Peptidase family M23 [Bartonella sp. JB63]
MWDNQHQTNDPGQDPALVIQRSKPANRQVSVRWLTGTILTGVTSCILMGIALFAALEGKHTLITPAQWFLLEDHSREDYDKKGDRIAPTHARQSFDKKRQFELSTLQKKGNKQVVETQNFEWIRMALAEERRNKYTYPPFDALSIFSNDSNNQVAQSLEGGQIYGAKIETKMTLHSRDFIIEQTHFDETDILTDEEAQKEIQKSGFSLDKNNENFSPLPLLDPTQLNISSSSLKTPKIPNVRLVQENVTVTAQNQRIDLTKNYAEDIIPIRKKQTILEALQKSDYSQEQMERIAKILAKLNRSNTLKAGSLLRIGIVTQQGEEDHLVRASIYQGMNHIITIALNDDNQFVVSTEPEMSHVLKTAFEKGQPHSYVNMAQLPTVYDAIYQAVLSHNMSQSLSQHLIRLLAMNIDMKSRITPTDQLEIFYAVPKQQNTEKNNKSTKNGMLLQTASSPADPEIRYISATFGSVTYKYYRYQSKNSGADYYDSEGKSSKPFLLRKPIPNGIFGSPFGPRKHPILGYVRMHTGVDWVAPKGSPIIAVGDGVVTKVGVVSGYGNHTEIKHANGYVSSYSHQNNHAANIKPGVKVRQGQIIGYVGSTGLATGPHCHFEIVVNGKKVDPMRIRLPDSKSLKDQDLQTFLKEKKNIDALIYSVTQPENAS